MTSKRSKPQAKCKILVEAKKKALNFQTKVLFICLFPFVAAVRVLYTSMHLKVGARIMKPQYDQTSCNKR